MSNEEAAMCWIFCGIVMLCICPPLGLFMIFIGAFYLTRGH